MPAVLINRPTETLTYRSLRDGRLLVFSRTRGGKWDPGPSGTCTEWPAGTTFDDHMMLVLGRRLESLGWQRFPVLE